MAKRNPGPKVKGSKPKADERVIWVEFEYGHASTITFYDGAVRVYEDEKKVDTRLLLGGHKIAVIRTVGELKAQYEAYKKRYKRLAGKPEQAECKEEYFVKLDAARKVFDKWDYKEADR